MEEMIDKEFEEYQKQLELRSKKLKQIFKFNPDKKINDIFDELKKKEIVL